MRKSDVCARHGRVLVETRGSSEKTITTILGGCWWPQTAKQDGDRISEHFHVAYGRISVMSGQMLEVLILVG